MRDEPVVRHEWPIKTPSGIAPGKCIDSGFVLTDHDDCDVCLMVNQVGDFDGPRHALLRMSFHEAGELADALVAATWERRPGRERTLRHPDNPNFCGCLGGCVLSNTECRRNGVRCRYRNEEVQPLSRLVPTQPTDQQNTGQEGGTE